MAAIYGGAELGECLAAAASVTAGDRESWHRAWTTLADRTFAAAELSAAHGHRESARCAFLRASNYYRNAYVFHLEVPLRGAVRNAYRQHPSMHCGARKTTCASRLKKEPANTASAGTARSFTSGSSTGWMRASPTPLSSPTAERRLAKIVVSDFGRRAAAGPPVSSGTRCVTARRSGCGRRPWHRTRRGRRARMRCQGCRPCERW